MVSVRIKPIIPRGKVPDLAQLVKTELRREVVNVKRELELPTRRWKHKVVFYEKQPSGAQSSGVEIATDSRIFKYVDQGTKPHIIKPRKAKVLAFNSIFKPQTKPNSLNSSAGRNSPPKIFTSLVHHPGTKARNFTRLVLKRSRNRFPKAVDKAIRLAVQRANKT